MRFLMLKESVNDETVGTPLQELSTFRIESSYEPGIIKSHNGSRRFVVEIIPTKYHL